MREHSRLEGKQCDCQHCRKWSEQLARKPGPSELLTAEEMADAAPFYLVLRDYVRQLKAAREAAGLTLAEVSERSGLAIESLSRLETGAQTNPTWKTLGAYANALGATPSLSLVQPDSNGTGVPAKARAAGARRSGLAVVDHQGEKRSTTARDP